MPIIAHQIDKNCHRKLLASIYEGKGVALRSQTSHQGEFMRAFIMLGFLVTSFAHANPSTCMATCIYGAKSITATVRGHGLDQDDALSRMKQQCDDLADKELVHYLATSFNKPNLNTTATEIEFDIRKACFTL